MTYRQLRVRVCQTLGIPPDDPQDEEYVLVGSLINEGVADILSRTRLHVRCIHMRLVPGKDDYEIDDSIFKMRSLKIGSTKLEQGNRDHLAANEYALPGHNLIVLGSAPSEEADLEAWYVPRPTEMSVDDDNPADPKFGNVEEQFQPALINYALWHAADTLDDTSSQSGERYRVMYEGQDGNAGLGTNLGRIKSAVNRRGGDARSRYAGDLEVIDSDPYIFVG